MGIFFGWGRRRASAPEFAEDRLDAADQPGHTDDAGDVLCGVGGGAGSFACEVVAEGFLPLVGGGVFEDGAEFGGAEVGGLDELGAGGVAGGEDGDA